MKYLKVFEDYNEYYIQTSENEYFNATRKIFDKSYDIKIKSMLITGFRLFRINDFTTSGIEIRGKGYYEDFQIFQANDEWFYVREKVQDIMSCPYNDFFSHYKCDQFDGLLEFLKNHGVIK